MWFSERGLRVSRSFWLLVLLAAVVSPLSVALSVLLAAALHECGHLLALRAFHVPVEELHLSAFGAVIHARGARRLSYGRELIVTLAGCGMNLVCGFLTALSRCKFHGRTALFLRAHTFCFARSICCPFRRSTARMRSALRFLRCSAQLRATGRRCWRERSFRLHCWALRCTSPCAGAGACCSFLPHLPCLSAPFRN